MQVTLNLSHLAAVIHCAATKDVRYYLKTVKIEAQASKVIMVATTGAVAGVTFADRDAEETECCEFLLPIEKAVEIVKKAKGQHTTQLMFTPSGEVGQPGTIAVPSLGLTFKASEGVFPDWRRILPLQCTGEAAQFDPELCMLMVKASKAMGNKHGSVQFTFNGDGPALVQVPDHPAFVGVVMPKRFPKWEPLSASTATASFRN